jgi:hypothetical protein
MGTVIGGFGGAIGLSRDTAGRTYITGLNETRRAMIEMGLERNLFEKWIKESALLAAKEATRIAPRVSGSLAVSVRGFASKSMNIKSRTTGAVERRFAFGGVVTAGSPARVQYARRISYGMRHVAGEFAKTAKEGTATRQWRTTVRTPGNAYMVKAREAKKNDMVELLNRKIRYWIKQKGFDTNGL